MANRIDTAPWGNSVGPLQRTLNIPLDNSSYFTNLGDAQIYAKGEGSIGALSYVGQIISVKEGDKVKLYKIADAAGTLSPIYDSENIETASVSSIDFRGGLSALTAGTVIKKGDLFINDTGSNIVVQDDTPYTIEKKDYILFTENSTYNASDAAATFNNKSIVLEQNLTDAVTSAQVTNTVDGDTSFLSSVSINEGKMQFIKTKYKSPIDDVIKNTYTSGSVVVPAVKKPGNVIGFRSERYVKAICYYKGVSPSISRDDVDDLTLRNFGMYTVGTETLYLATSPLFGRYKPIVFSGISVDNIIAGVNSIPDFYWETPDGKLLFDNYLAIYLNGVLLNPYVDYSYTKTTSPLDIVLSDDVWPNITEDDIITVCYEGYVTDGWLNSGN